MFELGALDCIGCCMIIHLRTAKLSHYPPTFSCVDVRSFAFRHALVVSNDLSFSQHTSPDSKSLASFIVHMEVSTTHGIHGEHPRFPTATQLLYY